MRLFISFCMIICLSFLSLVAEAVIIEAKRANVRSSPGTSSEILFVYRQNAPLEVLETQENWIKVRDFEKDIGWVSKKVISEGQRGAIVKVSNANVRKGPSGDHPVIFVAGYGVAFRVLEQQGEWFHIQHEDGDMGWVHQELVYAP